MFQNRIRGVKAWLKVFMGLMFSILLIVVGEQLLSVQNTLKKTANADPSPAAKLSAIISIAAGSIGVIIVLALIASNMIQPVRLVMNQNASKGNPSLVTNNAAIAPDAHVTPATPAASSASVGGNTTNSSSNISAPVTTQSQSGQPQPAAAT